MIAILEKTMNITYEQFFSITFQVFLQLKDKKLSFKELDFIKYIAQNYQLSESQLFQDLFVMFKLNKKNGTFVDFGATNGKHINNSWMLEKHFDWSGIVCEPDPRFHEELKRNRNCFVETKCVSNISNQTVTFLQTDTPDLSTISGYDNDEHDRKQHTKISVETISLNDMLENYKITEIDYLSIDTEGSEFDILSSFDIDRYLPTIITVEHNYTENRNKIHNLLSNKGYKKEYEMFSRWDDWYVLER